ncbi:BQ5605_C048g12383 [Microbotryum silenes-dioicae]|uniref:BQ5605_C048g12383 protein n=1 Tax=Microbotryum silenes-dioicae TaxID=796604 RepID=A0A2X0PHS1_9BASI|nr:BQ5605_C048g12383 [Microbotryum silenes-dioicae]
MFARTNGPAWTHIARCIRHSSSSAKRTASVLSSPSAASAPPPPPPTAESEAALRPQPFIPKPLSRSYQVASLSPSSRNPNQSTTISLQRGTAPKVELELPNLFLRDASVHPSHVHPTSQQKLFRTSDIPLDAHVIGYGVHEITGEDHLVMEWSAPVHGVEPKSAKLSVTPLNLLVKALEGQSEKDIVPRAKAWDRQALLSRLKTIEYAEFVRSEQTLFDVVDAMLKDGLVFLKNVPTSEKEGQDTELKRLVTRIASVRRTWYGDLFDVKAEKSSKNIAYTNLDLGLHMDLIHFAHPPRWQFLQSLLNGGIIGGSSYFVDSYAVAMSIRSIDPSSFDVLTRELVRFEYKNEDYHTRYDRPVIELASESTLFDPIMTAINYSPPFQGPLPLPSTPNAADRLAKLHRALQLFAQQCDDPAFRYDTQLQPGDCALFDNRRVLHARTAFEFESDKQVLETIDEQERGRWLKGAYADGDEVLSRWRVLNAKRIRCEWK